MTIENIKDNIVDTIEKVSTPATRSGAVVERVAKLVEAGIDAEVIALQMTKNSQTNHQYTLLDVATLNAVYQDSKSRTSVLSKKQTTALIRDQEEVSNSLDLVEA